MGQETTEHISLEIRQGLPVDGSRIAKYTAKAFRMLPKLDNPRILDIGCGRGGPTMELARLSQGWITAVDIDQPSLDIHPLIGWY